MPKNRVEWQVIIKGVSSDLNAPKWLLLGGIIILVLLAVLKLGDMVGRIW
jgi:hypothetical protein